MLVVGESETGQGLRGRKVEHAAVHINEVHFVSVIPVVFNGQNRLNISSY